MRRYLCNVVAACLLLNIIAVGTVVADDAVKNFNIPEEDLGSALRDFGRQSNQEVLFSTDIVRDKKTPGLKGSYTVEAAIATLLAGTDLTVRRTANGALLITRRDTQVTSDAADPTRSTAGAEGNVAGQDSTDREQTVRLQEVIVTATRRALSVQQVEGGLVPITQALVRDTGAQTLADVANAAPGLSFGQMSPTEQVFTVRGVNTTSQVSNLQSPTALYFDEVPVSDPYLSLLTPSFQLFDVNRVEVLLGPQGTLFGAGALGGAVRVISNKPALQRFDADVEQTVEFSSTGNPSYATNAMLNLPLISDSLALRLVGSYIVDGGYIDNIGLGDTDYNQVHMATVRSEVLWRVSPQFSLTATYAYESDRPNASPYTEYGSRDYVFSSGLVDRSREVLNIANVVAEYTGDRFTFTSSTSYLHRDPTQQTDITALVTQVTGLATPASDVLFGHTRNLVQEFRIASPTQQGFQWLGGIYLQKYNIDEMEVSIQPGAGAEFASIGFPSDTVLNDVYTGYVNEAALFGEVSYDFTSEFSATVGARAFHDSVAVTDVYGDAYLDGGPGSLHNSATYARVTPKFGISYKPSHELMTYAQISEGFRSGEGNLNDGHDPVTGTPIPTFYGPDYLWNYEVGAKSTLFGRTTLNGDLYDIDWRGIQLQQLSPSGLNFTANAGRAWIHGVDFQITSQLSDATEVGANLDYHRSRLTEVNNGVNGVVGDELPGSSRLSSYVYGKYKFNLGRVAKGFLRVDYSYSSKAYSDLDNATSLHYGNVASIDAQTGLHLNSLEFLLFCRNLADARNRVNAFELVGEPAQVLQTPRTIGLTARWNY